MTKDKAYLPPAIRAQVVRHSVMQSNKCFNRNLMLNVPDVSPSYALLPGDALHSLIGKGKKVKIKEKIRCKKGEKEWRNEKCLIEWTAGKRRLRERIGEPQV